MALQAIVRIIESTAGSSLFLQAEDFLSHGRSLGCLGILVLVTLVPLLVVVGIAVNEMNDGGVSMMTSRTLLPLTIFLAVVGTICVLMRSPVAMELRRDMDAWTTTTASLGAILRRDRSFRLSSVDRLEVERLVTGPEPKGGQKRSSEAPFVLRVLATGQTDTPREALYRPRRAMAERCRGVAAGRVDAVVVPGSRGRV